MNKSEIEEKRSCLQHMVEISKGFSNNVTERTKTELESFNKQFPK